MMKKTVLFALVTLLFSNSVLAVKFQPFEGTEGYQDIKISANTFYVGFHGGRDSAANEVAAAWATRSAELCSQAGAKAYVQLNYLFEPLTQMERDQFAALEAEPHLARTAGYIYIPMYIPSGPRAAKVDAPSKLAAVRCLQKTEDILDQKRLVVLPAGKP